MRVLNIHADPHPEGHRIDLSWTLPPSPSHPGVRVVRRKTTHPTLPDDGVVLGGVTPSGGLDGAVSVKEHEDGRVTYRLADMQLQGGRVYYYALFPYRGSPPAYAFDSRNRASGLAGAHHGAADRMMELLPRIYARYDEADGEAGPLRRFLDLPGGQLDLLRTFADTILDARDVNRIEGTLLPLLAQWIGWRSDHHRELDTQRNEIRHAPALYRRVGVIPTVEATVKRITGWESRTKEYVHNVARTNTPPRLTLHRRVLDGTGAPFAPEEADAFDSESALLSIDDAHDGRPSVATDGFGVRWLVYHTRRRGRLEIRYKTSPVFPVSGETRGALEDPEAPGTVSEALQEAFLAAGHPIEATASVTESVPDRVWVLDEGSGGERYVLEAAADAPWTAYHTTAPPTEWAPSRPLATAEATLKDPVVVVQGDALWVFWAEYDEDGPSRIRYQRRADGAWSPAHALAHPVAAGQPERRDPAATVDANGDLWLFWRERTGGGWALVYDVHDGTADADGFLGPSGWAEPETVRFPDDGGGVPEGHDDVFVSGATRDGDAPLVVFWARKEAVPAVHEGATRWRVAARRKTNLTPNDPASWEAVDPLPVDDETIHDREPAALPLVDGTLLAVWASTRDGGWSVWRAPYDPATGGWGSPEAVSGLPFAERAPVLLGDPQASTAAEDLILTVYRTSASRVHESELYGATVTEDARYSGTTTVRATDGGALSRRGTRADTQSYTYDTGSPTGRTDDDWYARDTIGVFIEPETVDPDTVGRQLGRLRQVLREFLPVTDRAVLRLPEWDVSPAPHTDYVYRYDAPPETPVGIIGEAYSDHLSTVTEESGPGLSGEAASTLTATVDESVPAPTDDHSDRLSP